MRLRTIAIIILSLLLIGAVIAVTQSITTFTTGYPNATLIFTTPINQTLYIEFPLYVYSQNLTITIQGEIS